MRNRIGKAHLVFATGLALVACNGEDSVTTLPGTSYGGYAGSTAGSLPIGQGGGILGQGGAVSSKGGASSIAKGGAAGAGVVGGAKAVGGASASGGSKATGGASVATGGKSTGGASSGTGGKATGGSSAATGGKTATGGTSSGVGGKTTTGGSSSATGGTSAAGGSTSTAPKNLFTVGPYTGAGWVAGGTVDGKSTSALLTTFTNPTISGTTQTFASKTALCMSGTIPALKSCSSGATCSGTETMNYSENWGALLGLNTSATEGTPAGKTFSKIAVKYTGTVSPASTAVRLQVQLKSGTTYCYNGYASELQLSTADLTQDCCKAGGTPLTSADTANITSIQLLVASSTTAETFTSLCMTDIVLDGSGGSGPTVTCNDTSSASGTLTGANSYATLPTSSGSKSYILQSNWWTAYAGQTEAYSGLGFTVNGSGSFQSPSNPLGYPSLFIGSYVGHSSVGSNLPKQVSSLTTIPTVYQWSGSSDTSRFNASYDVWFTQSNALVTGGDPRSGGAYLMVWMFKPSNQTPRGSVVNASVTIPGAPGTWEVWYDTSGVAPCVSYVANSKLDSITFDLNEFIKNAVTNKWGVNSSQYLSIIFGGFEIWEGHSGLKLDKFCAHVN
ncbi:MAG: hypothetical protein QM784_20375 [Polyangiaceae bacterium]